MRGIARVGMVCIAAAGAVVPSPAAAQDASLPPNPGSACFQLLLEGPDGAVHQESVEFILAPAESRTRLDGQAWDLHGPVRAESAALWSPARADSIAAWWLRDEGVLWELRLDALPEIMSGTAVQVMPGSDDGRPWTARAVPRPCEGSDALPEPLGEGLWSGHLTPMNHPEQRTLVDLRVSRADGAWVLELRGPEGDGLPARDVEVEPGRVRFTFDEPEAGVALRCDLSPDEEGGLVGRCRDASGRWAALRLRPPGSGRRSL